MSKAEIKQAKWEVRDLKDLTNWENNPRSILKEDFERLKGQIERLGVHNGLLVNQDNIVLGGNMRLRAFQELNKTYNLEKVMCRVIETSDPGMMLEYALSDNDQMGTTDDLKLAEVFHLSPIETRLYKLQSNVLRPLETIINPPEIAVNEMEEYVGMPEFEGKNTTLKLIIHFDNIEDRDLFVTEKQLEINTKGKTTWITTVPFKPKQDYRDKVYEE